MPLRKKTPGNRTAASPATVATTTILLDALTPRALGALLALYEHKTFCLGALWQVNAFDQWGVELGKALAEPIHAQLAAAPSDAQAPSTAGLLATIKARR